MSKYTNGEPNNIIQFPAISECKDCNGRGIVTGFTGRIKSEHKCPRCNGAGFYQIKTPRVEKP